MTAVTCKPCDRFFARYKCAKYLGECDCPKCQGYCGCGDDDAPESKAGVSK